MDAIEMSTTMSPTIGALAGALAKAQGKITGALKDSANPFFKSKYADLASVWDACRAALSENAIAVIQTTAPDDRGVIIITTLAHESGEWVRGELLMIPKDTTPQGVGSAITYGRRYGLAGIVGVAQIDDDGNVASGKTGVHSPLGEVTVTAEVEGWAQDLREAVAANESAEIRAYANALHEKGEEVYRAVWSLLDSKTRSAIKRILKPAEAA